MGDGPATGGGPSRRRSRERAEPLLTWGALVVSTVVGLLLLGVSSGGSDFSDPSDPAGTTASAAVLSFVSPDSGPASVLARVVLFVATAVVAGLGLARALVGVRPARSGPVRRR